MNKSCFTDDLFGCYMVGSSSLSRSYFYSILFLIFPHHQVECESILYIENDDNNFYVVTKKKKCQLRRWVSAWSLQLKSKSDAELRSTPEYHCLLRLFRCIHITDATMQSSTHIDKTCMPFSFLTLPHIAPAQSLIHFLIFPFTFIFICCIFGPFHRFSNSMEIFEKLVFIVQIKDY